MSRMSGALTYSQKSYPRQKTQSSRLLWTNSSRQIWMLQGTTTRTRMTSRWASEMQEVQASTSRRVDADHIMHGTPSIAIPGAWF